MAFRWSNGTKNPMQAVKRGLASLFVCFVVALPLILTGLTIKRLLPASDSRKTGHVAAMQVRPIDKSSAPIKPFDEPMVLKVGDAYQRLTDWHTRRPRAAPAEAQVA